MSEAPSISGTGLPLGDRLRYSAEAAVFFAFMALFRVIGLPAASRLGGFIGRNILCWLPPDRIARANLLRAFPEKTLAERDAIRRTMWDNLGRVVGEYPHLDKFSPKGDDPGSSSVSISPRWCGRRTILLSPAGSRASAASTGLTR
jgi:lauroyl/myristoyl acyltransferase